ncbi:MAG TPA: CPBP family intramembrane glutamic endopeptidase [Pyrinomonadaceae bacterium]|nr:CPBP family intramembrane glutamic endopeptidase [Pyrinomonadaceae bacterium]
MDSLKPNERARWLAVWEIVSVLVSCLIAEWVVLAFVGRSKLIMAVPIILALALMIVSHRERGESLRDIGFRVDNFLPALRLIVLPTVAAIVVIIVIAFLANTTIHVAPWRNRFFALPLWALFQQYALNGFINRRAELVLGRGRGSVLLVGLCFGLVHLPNPWLTVLTMVGGLIWAAAYQRQQNLFALALSHALVSLTLALVVPQSLLHSLRVGFKYFG